MNGNSKSPYGDPTKGIRDRAMPLAMVVLDERKLARSGLERAPNKFGSERGQLPKLRLNALTDLSPSHLAFGRHDCCPKEMVHLTPEWVDAKAPPCPRSGTETLPLSWALLAELLSLRYHSGLSEGRVEWCYLWEIVDSQLLLLKGKLLP